LEEDSEEPELEDPETLRERLDALHPLPSDILTNSGAPRADNYFCGPRRPRLPRVFIYRGPMPPPCFSPPPVTARPLTLSLAVVHGNGDFSCWKPPPFCAFFFYTGPRAPPCPRSEKGEGRGKTRSTVLNHLETHESMNHLRSWNISTPPSGVILRYSTGPFVGSLNDQHARADDIDFSSSLFRSARIYIPLPVHLIEQRSIDALGRSRWIW